MDGLLIRQEAVHVYQPADVNPTLPPAERQRHQLQVAVEMATDLKSGASEIPAQQVVQFPYLLNDRGALNAERGIYAGIPP